MNEHAGLGCALSVLIVIGFTVVFHEKERPTAPGPTPVSTQAQAKATPPIRSDRTLPEAPPTTSNPIAVTQVEMVRSEPGPPLTSTRIERSSIVESVNSLPATVSLVSSQPKTRPINPTSGVRSATVDSRPTTKPTPRLPSQIKSSPTPPKGSTSPNLEDRRSSTTIIAKGEKLVDVAIRVYGSAEATFKLWRANRDQLSSLDAQVSEGWLLRTP